MISQRDLRTGVHERYSLSEHVLNKGHGSNITSIVSFDRKLNLGSAKKKKKKGKKRI